MSQSAEVDASTGAPTVTSALPGFEVVARIRRLLVVGVLAALGYAAFMSASKGFCPGGVSDGGFIDAAGNPTDVAPTCVNLTLRPSPLILAAIAVIVFWALTRVLRRAVDVPSAIRIVDRAAAAIVILVVASVVISQVWFALIPLTDWDGTGTFFYPFPFGSVDMQTSPMQVS
ncbi:hypothetical protein [Microbacterium sp. H1-D42]|uniref:hypothetical protein n=1 Tax=Microbacterium sp. H1-D42 TaxID=2925844 RepID=UPI001F52DD8E|nr:hypothetical protein [Microbacterium sp. H1-D42]UNK69589.1 hypothetical protein MNR00_10405 [Microbacterium sp. H1-D42]